MRARDNCSWHQRFGENERRVETCSTPRQPVAGQLGRLQAELASCVVVSFDRRVYLLITRPPLSAVSRASGE